MRPSIPGIKLAVKRKFRKYNKQSILVDIETSTCLWNCSIKIGNTTLHAHCWIADLAEEHRKEPKVYQIADVFIKKLKIDNSMYFV